MAPDIRMCSIAVLCALSLMVFALAETEAAPIEGAGSAVQPFPIQTDNEVADRAASMLWSQYLLAPDDDEMVYPESKRAATRYSFGLGKRGIREFNTDEYKKRRYNFGLGKRAYDAYAALKARPHYNFGIGK